MARSEQQMISSSEPLTVAFLLLALLQCAAALRMQCFGKSLTSTLKGVIAPSTCGQTAKRLISNGVSCRTGVSFSAATTFAPLLNDLYCERTYIRELRDSHLAASIFVVRRRKECNVLGAPAPACSCHCNLRSNQMSSCLSCAATSVVPAGGPLSLQLFIASCVLPPASETDHWLHVLLPLLPAADRERISRKHFTVDRLRSAVGQHLMLRVARLALNGQDPDILRSLVGRPQLPPSAPADISLSHHGRFVVAVGTQCSQHGTFRNVGLDVLDFSELTFLDGPAALATVATVLCAEERDFIERPVAGVFSSADCDMLSLQQAFACVWTSKEAFVKVRWRCLRLLWMR